MDGKEVKESEEWRIPLGQVAVVGTFGPGS
jgi:hypothetical protein